MRVFLAGATGAVGRPLVGALLAGGHEVTGLTRSPQKAARLREAGATPVVCDAYDFDGLRRALEAARPEVVIHQLTALPAVYDMRNYERTVAATNRLRTEVTPVLLEGARGVGARRFVSQSIAFIYAPVGGPVKDERAPTISEGPDPVVATARATVAMEQQVTGAAGLEGVVLRYGQFYGRGTYYAADGSIAREVRRRRFPIVGPGAATFSFLHVDDAAAAAVSALDRGPGGIYNVCDDEPARVADWLPEYARALGARPPRRVPVWLARLLAGSPAAQLATGMRGASNAKVKRELGWAPRYSSWREGFLQALG